VGHTFEYPRCNPECRFPRSENPKETMKVELRAGGYLEWAEPNDMGPGERGALKGCEAKRRGLMYTKPHEAQTP